MENERFEECMARIRNGDKEGLKEIYLAYKDYLYHLFYDLTGSREDAEDLTVEFFIRLWDLGEKFIPGGGHKRWLTVIARNQAMDFLRARNRELPYEQEILNSELEKEEQADAGYDQVIEDLTIREALQKLKPEEKIIVHLKVIGELTFRHIAGILKIPMGTVTWRYQQALKKLRRCGYEAL